MHTVDWIPITFVGLPIVLWEIARERAGRPAGALSPPGLRASRLTVAVAALLLIPLFAMQLRLLFLQTVLENGGSTASFAQFPIPVYIGRTFNPSIHGLYSAVAFALAAAESVCLLLLWAGARAFSQTRAGCCLLACAGSALAILAVFAPALSSTDPYEYIAAAGVGARAYGDGPGLGVANILYGPLWLYGSSLLLHLAHGAVVQIELLRALNASLVGAIVWMLARARCPREIGICFVLNPSIWFSGVANPHTELWGLAALVACFMSLRGPAPRIVTVLLLGAAACVKLPFLALGSALLTQERRLASRLTLLGWAVAISLAVSIAAAGEPLLSNFGRYAHERMLLLSPPQRIERVSVELFLIALLARGFVRGLSFRGAAWLMPQLALVPYPWYGLWGFCALMGDASWCLAFLAGLPVFTVMMDYNYDAHQWSWVFALFFSTLLTGDLIAQLRLMRRQPPAPQAALRSRERYGSGAIVRGTIGADDDAATFGQAPPATSSREIAREEATGL